MKKLFFIFLFIFVCSNCFSAEVIADKPVIEATQDYWVYVNLKDKSGVTADDDKGRSKRGDIIDIVVADGTNIPSEVVKNDFAIIKVSGLTDEHIAEWKEEWEGKSYRKNRLKTSFMKTLSLGIHKDIVTSSKLNVNKRSKNNDDLALYENKRKVYAYVKRPALILYGYVEYAFDYWVMPAYAFSTTTCADDDTEDREQICTVNKSGEDYASISLWEAAKDGDLVTDKQIRTLECYNDDGVLENEVNIDGSTTSTDYYMIIRSATGEGINSDEKLSLETGGQSGFTWSNGNGWHIGKLLDDYIQIHDLSIDHDTSTSGQTAFDSNSIGIVISNVIIRTNYKFNSGNESASITFRNVVLYWDSNNVVNESSGSAGLSSDSNSEHTLENVTIYGFEDGDGIEIWSNGTTLLTNVVSAGNAIDFDVSHGGTYTLLNCASSDTTAEGTGAIDSITPSDEFVSVTDDFKIKSTSSNLKAGGYDLSATFTDDIFGDTRSAWDIGADEYVAAASARRMMIIQ